MASRPASTAHPFVVDRLPFEHKSLKRCCLPDGAERRRYSTAISPGHCTPLVEKAI